MIASIPEAEKDALMFRLADSDTRVATELRTGVRTEWTANNEQSGLPRRTVREPRERSLVIREERRVGGAEAKEGRGTRNGARRRAQGASRSGFR